MNIIKNNYINSFFKDLTFEDKKEIYFEQFMWHAFSYKKISAIEGKEAITEFNKIKNNDVYIFFEDNDIVLEKTNLNYKEILEIIELQSKKDKLTSYYDCYIVDKNFSWTFIITHETQIKDDPYFYIGPFFSKIENKNNLSKAITYQKFKELFNSLDSAKNHEIAIYFSGDDNSYILIKHNNYLTFGKEYARKDKILKFNTLDDLYNSNNIYNINFKQDWNKIEDILIDMTFSVIDDKEIIKSIYNFDL